LPVERLGARERGWEAEASGSSRRGFGFGGRFRGHLFQAVEAAACGQLRASSDGGPGPDQPVVGVGEKLLVGASAGEEDPDLAAGHLDARADLEELEPDEGTLVR
jgi:hypothetical protein